MESAEQALLESQQLCGHSHLLGIARFLINLQPQGESERLARSEGREGPGIAQDGIQRGQSDRQVCRARCR